MDAPAIGDSHAAIVAHGPAAGQGDFRAVPGLDGGAARDSHSAVPVHGHIVSWGDGRGRAAAYNGGLVTIVGDRAAARCYALAGLYGGGAVCRHGGDGLGHAGRFETVGRGLCPHLDRIFRPRRQAAESPAVLPACAIRRKLTAGVCVSDGDAVRRLGQRQRRGGGSGPGGNGQALGLTVRVIIVPRRLDNGEGLAEPVLPNVNRSILAGVDRSRRAACGGDGVVCSCCQPGKGFIAVIDTGVGGKFPFGGHEERNYFFRILIVVRPLHAGLDVPCSLGILGAPCAVIAVLLPAVCVVGRSVNGGGGGVRLTAKNNIRAGQAGDAVAGLANYHLAAAGAARHDGGAAEHCGNGLFAGFPFLVR